MSVSHLLSRETTTSTGPHQLMERVDLLRLDASRRIDPERKAALAQFFTTSSMATFMASMLMVDQPEVNVLDAGAGIGSLFCATVAELCSRPNPPPRITVTAYELDESLLPYLENSLALCRQACAQVGTDFSGRVCNEDFIESAVSILRPSLFVSSVLPSINCVILNPPYLKIRSSSSTREMLRHLGIETSNLYTAFMAVAVQLLQPGGEFVAITPRSFCNGPYFRPFREHFLREVALRRLHVFDSREAAFRDDEVLQENVIVHAVKDQITPKTVVVTSNAAPDDDLTTWRNVPFEQVVFPGDPQSFIRIVPDELDGRIAGRMAGLTNSLADLGLTVSTGRVVDFRSREHLCHAPGPGDVPLIYPTHLEGGSIIWPKLASKKANAIALNAKTKELLIPAANYVLVKRFSSKEERRRVVASVIEPHHISGDALGIENHLNYFHARGAGLDLSVARGLAIFLNSTLVDAFFRQFNGHTQVNATDLRSLRYPSIEELRALGEDLGSEPLAQDEIDRVIEARLVRIVDTDDPIQIKTRIAEARGILKNLGFPKRQQNERSALTLLALLDLPPNAPWSDASDPLRGVRPIMDYVAAHYGRQYAENSRESFRRETIHQFRDAGLIVGNPDDPARPTNSGKTVYQVDSSALELLRIYGQPEWDHGLGAYLSSVETLQTRYARERAMRRIPVQIAPNKTLDLSQGGQNVLVKEIIEQFAERFTPGGLVLYVGDTDEKFAYFDEEALTGLGVSMEAHGKMPDVIIHHTEKNWLVLVEAVTSHGPVNPKRRAELEELFSGSTAGLVFVTAFLDRRAMARYLDDIAWETEVWVAEHPTHLIHFNGEQFLGSY